MRVIKFRGKRVDNGEWVYGDFQENIDCYKIREKEKGIKHIPTSYVVETNTIGQFIGIKDINGKEIYEGDIVQDKSIYMTHLAYSKQGIETIEQAEEYRNSGDIGTVSFLTDGSVASSGDFYDYFVGSGFKVNNVDLTCCEIIGNIYDNPELLEKESK